MGRHTLTKSRVPQRYGTPAKCRRPTLAQSQRRGWYGQMGGIGIAAAVIAAPLVFGGVAVVAGFPLDLSSPPSPSTGQRPIGPSWLPGSGVGLHLSIGNPLFRANVLDGSVASSPEVLHAALSFTVPSSNQPVGLWVGGRWISADPYVKPTEPCPSPTLDPEGWARWWAKYFPHVTPPTPPVGTVPPPVVTSPVVIAPDPAPVATPAPVQEPSSPPPVMPSPVAETPPPAEAPAPVVVDVPVVDPAPVDLPPVTVPVVDVPVDVPPVDVPPVDVSPITDPVAAVVDDTVSAVVPDEPDVTQLPVDVNSVVPNVSKQLTDVTTGAAEDSTRLAGAVQVPSTQTVITDHSTSGNVLGGLKWGDPRARDGGSSYVGRHRLEQSSRVHGDVGSERSGRTRAVAREGSVRVDSGRHGDQHGSSGRDHRGTGGGRHRAVDHGGSHGHSDSHGNSGGNHGGGHGHR